jgi:hypothetical protein
VQVTIIAETLVKLGGLAGPNLEINN